MSDYRVTINLSDHLRGDRWEGIPVIGPVTVGGSTPAGALERISMTLKLGASRYTLDSDPTQSPDAPIVISDAATWEANVPEVGDFLQTAGGWEWDMKFYETGKPGRKTYYKGVLTVNDDIS